MELNQLRLFVRLVEFGSLDRAAAGLGMSPSALQGEIDRVESEAAAPLLRNLGDAIAPTEAGIRFFREAKLSILHADQALRATNESHHTGTVTIGLPPTVAAVLGLPLMQAIRQRYPHVHLRLIEGLSGHLASLLGARRLDIAVLYGLHPQEPWTSTSLVTEKLYFIQSTASPAVAPLPPALRFSDLAGVPLILPTQSHELRTILDAAFSRARLVPAIVCEVDSLVMLMEAVDAGLGSTVQAWSATRRHPDAASRLQLVGIQDSEAHRVCTLCSLPPNELAPAAFAARVVLSVCARELVRSRAWLGTELGQG